MNLHSDKRAFKELVTATSIELKIPPNIVEKDYYVTLVLHELSSRIKGMVFKGGTSLTKCYQILDRFSEDIDISYDASDGPPGESRKRQLKKAITASMEALDFPITNLNHTRSRRNYNCYRAEYPTIYTPMLSLKPEIVIETYIALLPFPTTVRLADNYIYRFLSQSGLNQLAERFCLTPFPVTTQSIERTLVDKVFAICDYYLLGDEGCHSRHLYDLYKIVSNNILNPSLPSLVKEVRHLRALLPVCPSAADGMDINRILTDIIENEVYRSDYENVTKSLLFSPVTYESAILSLWDIISSQYFA